ncbi:MAG TPA: hypothetical protein VFP68_03765 [Burkholderiaceae bacterium]|nr:hypothetical protein [Burkholderiaceae bacterium]
MAKWTAFPYDASPYAYHPGELAQHWSRLHAGDAEVLPDDETVLAAWGLFHAGAFQKAYEAGLNAGVAGMTVANKAQAIYANYLEKSERIKLAMLMEVAHRAEAQQASEPTNPNAFYWQAYALGRYGQSISVVKALSQGLGVKVKNALETTIRLAPQHADAHIGLGTFHAEIIDNVGSLMAKAQGATKEAGLRMFKEALRLNPSSAIGRVEYAHGLVMLEGEKRIKEAEQLYVEAAACEPIDATERLDVEIAKAELQD